ncbi:hypothetical protein D3C81_713020 [compost metagenome]
MADAHRHVQPLVDQIQVAIVEHHFNLHLRIKIEKRHDHRCHVLAPELHRRGNAQQAAELGIRRIQYRRLVFMQQ